MAKKALVPVEQGLLGAPFKLQPTGLTVMGSPTKGEYITAFKRLALIEGAIHWWYGDLCLAYEGQYGAIAKIAEEAPYDYNTIANDKWVASRYKVSHRCETLSWKHHRIAAPLDDRLEWLKKAEKNNWPTRTLELEINKVKRRQLLLPPAVYDVIYADPPWEYSNVLPQWGAAEIHYDTMSIQALCTYIDDKGTRIQDKFAENSVLFLWVTNPFLRDVFQVIDAWGFQYKTNLVWIKTGLKKPGSGFWLRGRHELLFICSRGAFVPDQAGKEPIGSVIEGGLVLYADVEEHSKKPDITYELIEKMYPEGKYLELFARNGRKGWTSWGNEITRGSAE